MEEKHFGVQKSLLKELKSFQLTLKKKRKIYFDVQLGCAGFIETRIYTGEGRVIIQGFDPFHVFRQSYRDEGPAQISIIYMGIIPITIKFESREQKEMFHREM
jgi:hypothetical protein